MTVVIELVGLQWGRDVSIPEMMAQRNAARDELDASMGPGCFHPRNRANDVDRLRIDWLQWGRDVSIPEIK